MSFTWTEELKAEASSIYQGKMESLQEENSEMEPASLSGEALKFTAESLGASAPSVRMILTKLNVYVKMQPKKSAPKAAAGGEGTKRVGKAEAQGELLAAFKDGGVEDLDEDILAKLTGKAALHLAEKVRNVIANQ